jgi:hypothetical protein
LKIKVEIVKPTLKGRGFYRLKDFWLSPYSCV